MESLRKRLAKTLEAAISAVVEGHLEGLPIVLAARPSDLIDAAASLPRLTLSRSALIRMLTTWRDGDCTAEDVQQWASFVRRGYIAARGRTPALSIDIEYDTDDEDLIVDVIGRLDEIGDAIDGLVTPEEQARMLERLRTAAA